MAYQTVNEQFGIMRCTPDDLTKKQVQMFREQYPGIEIRDLTMFYDPGTQTFVMNRARQGYEGYLETLLAYIEFSTEEKATFRELLAKEKKLRLIIGFLDLADAGLADRESKEFEKR